MHAFTTYLLIYFLLSFSFFFKFCKSILSTSSDTATLATLFQILHQLLKIFYCINIVDLPHVIEDHLDFWMKEQHLAYFFFESSDPKLIGDVRIRFTLPHSPTILGFAYSFLFFLFFSFIFRKMMRNQVVC